LTHARENIGVLFGFLKQILNVAERFETNRFMFCWDSGKSLRKKVFADYKRRKLMADEEKEKFSSIHRQFHMIRVY
jgi:5'-3' exonuclease